LGGRFRQTRCQRDLDAVPGLRRLAPVAARTRSRDCERNRRLSVPKCAEISSCGHLLENRVALELRDGVLVRRKPQRFDAISAALAEEPASLSPYAVSFFRNSFNGLAGKQTDSGRWRTIHSSPVQTPSVLLPNWLGLHDLDQDGNRFITLDPGSSKRTRRTRNRFSRTFLAAPVGIRLSALPDWKPVGAPRISRQRGRG